MVEKTELGGTIAAWPPKKKRDKIDYPQVELDLVVLTAIRENELKWFLRDFTKKQVRDSLAATWFAKGKIPKAVWGSICQHEFRWIGVVKKKAVARQDSMGDAQWEALKKAIRSLDPEHRKACNGISQAERLIRTKVSTNIKQLQGLPRSYRFWESNHADV